MTSLHRSVRQKTAFTVVRVRRIKHRVPSPVGPGPRHDGGQDLSGLIFYGQA